MERHLRCSLPVLLWCPDWRAYIYVPRLQQPPLHTQKMDSDPIRASSPPPTWAGCLPFPSLQPPCFPAQAPPPSMCEGLSPGLAGLQLQEIGTSPDHGFLFGDSNQRKPPTPGDGNGLQSLSACPWALSGRLDPAWPPSTAAVTL